MPVLCDGGVAAPSASLARSMQYRPVAIALCVLFIVSFASHQWYLQSQRSNTALGDIVKSAKLAFRTRLEAWEQTASALSCFEAGVDYAGGDIDEKTVTAGRPFA